MGLSTIAPNNYQIQLAYNGSNLEYVGYAERSVLTSEQGWIVFYLQYSGSDLISKKTGGGAWDNRAALTYA